VLAQLDEDDLVERWGPWVKLGLFDPAKDLAPQVKAGMTSDLPYPLSMLENTPEGVPSFLLVEEGHVLGVVGAPNHLHWEVRKKKLTDRYNPAVWARDFARGDVPPDVVEATGTPEDNLTYIVLALVAYAFIGGRKRW
jgi:hypothetical protein